MSDNTCFAEAVLKSPEYLCLSGDARALYTHIGIDATTIGEVYNPKNLARYYNLSEGAVDELVDAGFLLLADRRYFIKHYRVNNKKPTQKGTLHGCATKWAKRPKGLEFEGAYLESALVVRDDSQPVANCLATDCTEWNGKGMEPNGTRSEGEAELEIEREGEGSLREGEVAVPCPNCGAANEEGAPACFSCGALLPDSD